MELEKTHEGKPIYFRFGTNTFEAFSEMKGIPFDGIDNAIEDPAGFRDFLFCAYKMALRKRKEELKLDALDIGDWLDELSEDDYKDILKALNKTKIFGKTVEDYTKEALALAKELQSK